MVSALGRVESLPRSFQGELVVTHPSGWGKLGLGDSVAVNGCCLTVVRWDQDRVALEVMPETYRRTNLGLLEPGSAVNLEAPLALGDPVGGHLVSGHVDAVGEVVGLDPEENALWLNLRVPPPVGRYCVPQGSIAVDGCSLTLVTVTDRGRDGSELRISLIPHTVKTTAAAGYRPGSVVNLEVDQLARLVERLIRPQLGAARPGAGA